MTETINNKNNNSVTPATPQKQTKAKSKQVKTTKNSEAAKFKAKYFEYYDDVKTHNNGPYDW